MIIQFFFNVLKFPGKCATSFGNRLESILQNAIESSYLNKSSKNDLLRHKLWIIVIDRSVRIHELIQDRGKKDPSVIINGLVL